MSKGKRKREKTYKTKGKEIHACEKCAKINQMSIKKRKGKRDT